MFWNIENIHQNQTALIDDNSGKTYTYGELGEKIRKLSGFIPSGSKKLVFLFCDNSAQCIIAYLSLLRSGHAVYLANSKMDAGLKLKLINLYKPEILISCLSISDIIPDYKYNKFGKELIIYNGPESAQSIHNDLAVLLSTSGTTGSPKLVRLSYKNIQSNAKSIAEYLTISENERPATSLPLSYSFGLSVINSHLLKGASIFCTDKSMVMRAFWEEFSKNECTSFSGVPFNYQMLHRLKFSEMNLPSLTAMTQAGGHLKDDLIKYFYDFAKEKNKRFFVMYGQTEATARISFVPFEKLGEKIGSIGIPVPGGRIKVFSGDEEIKTPRITGELVYQGPNVMMGYAESRTDLSAGDELNGVLRTGDIGYLDKDGYAYITGRMKRFIKLFGLRVNLDEIEKMIEDNYSVSAACYGTDEEMRIFVQSADENFSQTVRQKIIDIYKLHHSVVRVKCIKFLPVNTSGKRDYKAIREMEI